MNHDPAHEAQTAQAPSDTPPAPRNRDRVGNARATVARQRVAVYEIGYPLSQTRAKTRLSREVLRMIKELPTLAEFRALRDFYQQERRTQVLPQLKARKSALKRQIDALRLLADWMETRPTKGLAWKEFQSALSHNHRREGLLSAAVELYPEYSEICGQVAVIESERGGDVPAWFTGKREAA